MGILLLSLITTNLSFGFSGAQVLALQQMLNRDPDTSIASVGSGSPGYETNYFGSLTKAAVVRFQEKYANEVLTPAGLSQGNGYVGQYTRAKLNALSAVATNIGDTNSPSTPSPTTTDSQNPNLKNVDKFFEALDKVATKKGYSASAIITMKETAMKRLATTTDLRATFLKQVQNSSRQSTENDSPAERVLATLEQAFDKIFMPEHARAATGAPFGGALLFAFPCDGGIWNLTIEPLPPSFAALLSYTTGSQAFLSYNIPATAWLLGEYEPIPMTYCWVGPYPYPSEGIITPMVGSSL